MSYGVIDENYWTGTTGRAIRERGGRDAQLLGVYLFSNHAANMLGLYRIRWRDIEDDIGVRDQFLVRAFQVCAETEFAYYEPASSFVWVREMARFRLNITTTNQLHRDDKRVIGAHKLYHSLPFNVFLRPLYDRYHQQLHLKKRTDYDAAPSPFEGASRGFEGAYQFSTAFPQASTGFPQADQSVVNSNTPHLVVSDDSLGLRRGFEGASKPVNRSGSDTARKTSTVAAPRRRPGADEDPPKKPVRVITKIAHDVIARLAGAPEGELREAIKHACARAHVPYDSAVVLAALKSAVVQRREKAKKVR